MDILTAGFRVRTSPEKLAEKINSFLHGNPEIEFVDVKYSSFRVANPEEYEYSALLIYKQKLREQA